jgi:hypothetical protein
MSSSGVHSCFFFPLWVGIILSLRCERRKNVFFLGLGERGGLILKMSLSFGLKTLSKKKNQGKQKKGVD